MNSSTRRSFFRTAGVGAAAVGGIAVLGAPSVTVGQAVPSAETGGNNDAASLPATSSGSLVAYIHDVSDGRVTVMVEGREVTITDHQLVAKLARAMAPSSPQV